MRSYHIRRFISHYSELYVRYRINNSRGFSWYTCIDSTVILGALPVRENIAKIQEENVRLVITINEPFELASIPTVEDFAALGIKNIRYDIPDGFGVPQIPQIIEIIKEIQRTEEEGYKTYVHCKAGRGRSASTVLCYLVCRYGVTVSLGLDVMKRMRPEVRPSPSQMRRVKEFEECYADKEELEGARKGFKKQYWGVGSVVQ